MKKDNFTLLQRSLEVDADPMVIFKACERISNRDYRILLESSEPGTTGSQQSMLLISQALKLEAVGLKVSIQALNANGNNALRLVTQRFQQLSEFATGSIKITSATEDELLLEYPDNRLIEEESLRVKRATPLDAIRQVLDSLSENVQHDADKLIVAGVAGYDLVDSLEQLPAVDYQEGNFPDYIYLLADSQIIIDQSNNRVQTRQIIFTGEDEDFRIGQARGKLAAIEEILKSQPTASDANYNGDSNAAAPTGAVSVYPTADKFKSEVLMVQEAIAKGQVFQTVISRNFSLQCQNPLLAYQYLKQQNPSPYQFYCQMGEFTLFGASPESSLRYQHQDRTIGIMPIAGTRPRGRTASGAINEELDARLEIDLKLDEKELAEHLMLVDLARNDLARVGETGSRKIKELMCVYRYSAVMHMVSRIEAKLRSDLDIYHACQSCFHMGTLTGAPKKEAMKLIRNIEQRRRGAYGGAVGYFTAAGDMDSAIVIRSALVKNNEAVITAGAGVVADSTPANELRETELKAAAVIRAIQLSEASLPSTLSNEVSDESGE